MILLLQGIDIETPPRVLWSLQYHQQPAQPLSSAPSNALVLPSTPLDLALPDSVLRDVKQAWQQITGDAESDFLKFDAREGTEEDES